jgi:hypothetical protein
MDRGEKGFRNFGDGVSNFFGPLLGGATNVSLLFVHSSFIPSRQHTCNRTQNASKPIPKFWCMYTFGRLQVIASLCFLSPTTRMLIR